MAKSLKVEYRHPLGEAWKPVTITDDSPVYRALEGEESEKAEELRNYYRFMEEG